MGLNFRKSIKLLPGVKLNLSKGGVSLSGGVKGLRASINTKGQVTGTASIPGTGVYYTKKKTLPIGKNKKDKTAKEEKEKKTAKKTSAKKAETKPAKVEEAAAGEEAYTPKPTFRQAAAVQPKEPLYQPKPVAAQVDMEAVRAIHKVADDTIDWSEIMASPTAPAGYDQQMWAYYYEAAPKVLDGDIDTYLQLIDEVNPLGDLLAYGSDFEFGTDDPRKLAVEYVVNQDVLAEAKRTMLLSKYNDLLQDFICSMAIRIARDMFALLPVSDVVVHAVLGSNTVLSADFDRDTLYQVKFGFVDPSEVMAKFNHNMKFSANLGFYPVERVW